MTIDRLYRQREQEWISDEIEIERAGYSGMHGKAIRYFRKKAGEYGVYTRVRNQIVAYRGRLIRAEDMTTNQEIADLFRVCPSTVSRYLLSLAGKMGESEDFKDREHVLRCAGGSRGGANGSTKGCKQKRKWSRKKKLSKS